MKKRRYLVSTCKRCEAEFSRRADHFNHDHCYDCANILRGERSRTHGQNTRNSRLYTSYRNMRARCENTANKKYPIYGARGIKVCDQWMDFIPFMEWANKNGYTSDKTLDRIDNDLGYSPENCRFVDVSTQNANRRKVDSNRSGYVGVWFDGKKYQSKVTWKGKQHHIGRYSSAEEAAEARDKFVVSHNMPHPLQIKLTRELKKQRETE